MRSNQIVAIVSRQINKVSINWIGWCWYLFYYLNQLAIIYYVKVIKIYTLRARNESNGLLASAEEPATDYMFFYYSINGLAWALKIHE